MTISITILTGFVVAYMITNIIISTGMMKKSPDNSNIWAIAATLTLSLLTIFTMWGPCRDEIRMGNILGNLISIEGFAFMFLFIYMAFVIGYVAMDLQALKDEKKISDDDMSDSSITFLTIGGFIVLLFLTGFGDFKEKKGTKYLTYLLFLIITAATVYLSFYARKLEVLKDSGSTDIMNSTINFINIGAFVILFLFSVLIRSCVFANKSQKLQPSILLPMM